MYVKQFKKIVYCYTWSNNDILFTQKKQKQKKNKEKKRKTHNNTIEINSIVKI